MTMYPPPYGGMAGSHQQRKSNYETEIRIPRQADRIFIACGIAVVAILEALTLTFPKLAFVLLGIGLVFGVSWLMVHWAGVHQSWLKVFVPLGLALGVPFALAVKAQLWAAMAAGVAALGSFVTEVTLPFRLHYRWWAVLAPPLLVLWAVFALKSKRQMRVISAVYGVGVLGYLAYVLEQIRWERLAIAWWNLRWVFVPYTFPLLAGLLALMLTMLKELWFPALEHSLKPMTIGELIEVGGILRLFWPKRANLEPPQTRVIEIQEQSNNGRTLKVAWLPDTPEMLAFAKCVLNGGDFTERDAKSCGVEVPMFREQIRDVFLDRGWAKWKNERHHQQGIVLLAAGRSKLRAIVEQS